MKTSKAKNDCALATIEPTQVGVKDIRACIFTVRGVQVMLDRDLAAAYHVSTTVFNQAVKRNAIRFPDTFRFQLTKEENAVLISQIVTSKQVAGAETRGGYHKLPYAFTEQGIAMLSGVLRSDVAVAVSIRLMNTFVEMRKTLVSLAPMLTRLDTIERRQITDQTRNEERFTEIFDAMQDKTFPPQKVFYNGQVFDARVFATNYILSAKKSILLIDSWVDVGTLEILSKKAKGVAVDLIASPRGNKLKPTDIALFNKQYGGLTVKTSMNFHDRFLIIDDKRLYLIGASLKDLGAKCFAFTQLDAREILKLKGRV